MEPSNRRRIVRALEVCLGTGKPFSSFGPGLTNHAETGFDLVGAALAAPTAGPTHLRAVRGPDGAGFEAEVRALAALDPPMSPTARQALGYRELLDHLAGTTTLDEALELARLRTRQFARRQERWFRRDPRIRWLDLTERAAAVAATAGDGARQTGRIAESGGDSSDLLRDWSGSRTAESG